MSTTNSTKTCRLKVMVRINDIHFKKKIRAQQKKKIDLFTIAIKLLHRIGADKFSPLPFSGH